MLTEIKRPGLEIREVIGNVRAKVQKESRETGEKQTVWDSSSLVGKFYPVSSPKNSPPADKREEWEFKLKEMENASLKARLYETKTTQIKAKLQKWEDFLKRYNTDNPFTLQDNMMRLEAKRRLAELKKATSLPNLTAHIGFRVSRP